MRHLIAEFAEELLNINNTPRHVFIEEAHEYVPQRVGPGMGKTFSAVEALVTMGRNRGIGVTLINQRAATVNKDVLTQLDTLLAFQNTSPQDKKALQDWVESHSAEGDFNKFMKSLPTLERGKGWIWSPEFMNVFERIEIRKRETFHPDREKLGNDFVMPQLDQTDIQSFITEFKKTPIKKEKTLKLSLIDTTPEQNSVKEMIAEEKIKAEIHVIKNDFESRLLQKDIEIRKLQTIINSIKKIIGTEQMENVLMPSVENSSSNLSMWLEKLGKGVASKTLKFLAEKSSFAFSPTQIALAVGTSKNHIYNNILPLLKRNSLVIKENSNFKISPNL